MLAVIMGIVGHLHDMAVGALRSLWGRVGEDLQGGAGGQGGGEQGVHGEHGIPLLNTFVLWDHPDNVQT